MSLMRQKTEDQMVGIEISDDPASFGACLQPGGAAAIWRRQTPPDVQNWLDALDPERLPRGREVVPADEVVSAVDQMFNTAGLPAGSERNWLRADIVGLARLFSDLMSAPSLRVRLDVVETNACRKFHIDAVTARLVCTYRGTGTQYGVSAGDGDPERVFTVTTGAPIMLRGTSWPSAGGARVLHRSPPIEGTGETRLVLVLDPIDEVIGAP